MNPRRFVIGDIHGAFRALEQCLYQAAFRDDIDELISLGDVSDSWPDTCDVVERLVKIKHIKLIAGNHDKWTFEWMITSKAPYLWTSQGGDATIKSYDDRLIPESHIAFLAGAVGFYTVDNKLFVHGGIRTDIPLSGQGRDIFMWDRSLVNTALFYKNKDSDCNITGFDEVFVGHTPTIHFGFKMPVKACEVWMMDTGAGWPGGVLSMMNIDTKELYISDDVSVLYKGVRGRY